MEKQFIVIINMGLFFAVFFQISVTEIIVISVTEIKIISI